MRLLLIHHDQIICNLEIRYQCLGWSRSYFHRFLGDVKKKEELFSESVFFDLDI